MQASIVTGLYKKDRSTHEEWDYHLKKFNHGVRLAIPKVRPLDQIMFDDNTTEILATVG